TVARGQSLGLGQDEYRIVGTRDGAEMVILGIGSQASFDPSFNTGLDTIVFPKRFAAYGFVLDGSVVRVAADDGTSAEIPIGTSGLQLAFTDGLREVTVDTETGTLSFEQLTQTAPELPPVDPEMASRVIFSPDGETSVGRGAYNLFGSAAGNEELVIGVGAQVTLDPSFNEGGDTIVLPGDFADFTATRNGSTLVLEDGLGTILRLPLGTEPTILGFDDGD
ncbi:hypothetical protein, partial [Pacificimonas aurantium]